ncbi:hypothetical protein [Streptomyces cremeus]|uniref:Uncharacterized protein n=1 Tax=Streptomyces cremeus TaxID=66881 RepID=A0ABV5PFP6_STRCM
MTQTRWGQVPLGSVELAGVGGAEGVILGALFLLVALPVVVTLLLVRRRRR